MTTIIVDTKRRLVASDSLMTTNYFKNSLFTGNPIKGSGKTTYSDGMQKLFKLKDGVIFACCGCQTLTNAILYKFGIPHTVDKEATTTKGSIGQVLITNPYTSGVMIIKVTAEDTNNFTTKTTFMSRCTNVRGGSGEAIAGKCFNKGVAIEDCIRYASYGDKYSGGKLQLMEY